MKTNLECGGKRSAMPLWIRCYRNSSKSKAPPLSAHSKSVGLFSSRVFHQC
jgi:hypothetical protein